MNNIKKLTKILQNNGVVTSAILDRNGISRHLREYYKQSDWIASIGQGAYKSPDRDIEWQDGISAIQQQLHIHLHIGGLTALSLHGYSHYTKLGHDTLHLFSPASTRLPKWFTDYDWGVSLLHKSTSFLAGEIGIEPKEVKGVAVNTSTPERGILECLYLAPSHTDWVECYQVLEGLVNLRPKLITDLLLSCNSVKVKRLFLYLAEKTSHQWLQFIPKDAIDLGSGDRMIAKGGVYNSTYQISIPKELAEL